MIEICADVFSFELGFELRRGFQILAVWGIIHESSRIHNLRLVGGPFGGDLVHMTLVWIVSFLVLIIWDKIVKRCRNIKAFSVPNSFFKYHCFETVSF